MDSALAAGKAVYCGHRRVPESSYITGQVYAVNGGLYM